ncbi:ABC transporter substrate-binding protein [Pueribacillus theae]|uniref:ABC transporter substrate-binding protein n=1 Tax=Pueribacillus theae TaxID=2171751 RepID=A0A2U1JTG6_9BACI|nr:ABC transporter substrate-binding protein [Pueribacillus theae]PWA08173.1 ABC transporter substrate-binding protein [Pueribacillus theae]
MKLKTMGQVFSAVLLAGALNGCGTEAMYEDKTNEGTTEIETTASTREITDKIGQTIQFKETPKRIVVLSPEFLMMLSELDVKVAGAITTGMEIPGVKDIPSVGRINEVNLEEVVALQPDLVIGQPNFHTSLVEDLKQNEIPLAILTMTSFENVKEAAQMLGNVLDIEEQVATKIAEAEKEVGEILSTVDTQAGHTVAILNVTPAGISIQKEGMTSLEIAEMLGLNNVAASLPSSPKSPTSAPYSMEELVALQPDYLFLMIHGAEEPGLGMIEAQLKKNPSWTSLEAVKNDRVHILPSEKFLTNPGFNYAESLQYMADLINGN